MEREHKSAIVVIGVAGLSAIAATLISGLLLTVIFPPKPGIHTPRLFAESVFIYALAALVPGGTFGFIVGIPIGWWWVHRGRRLPSRGQIFFEATGLGLIFGLAFPLYFRWVIGWIPGFPRSLVAFSGFDGAVCAVVIALVLTIKRGPNSELQVPDSPTKHFTTLDLH